MHGIRDFAGVIIRLTRGRVVIGLGFSVLATMTEGVSLVMLVPLIGLIQPEPVSGNFGRLGAVFKAFNVSLGGLLVAFVTLVLLQALLARWRTIYLGRIANEVSDAMRGGFFSAIALANWDVVQSHRVSDMNHVMTEEIDRIRLTYGSMLNVVQTLIVTAVYFGFALLVSWPMALVAGVIGCAMVLAMYPLRRLAARHGRSLTELARQRAALQLDMLSGMRVVKSFVAEHGLVDRFASHLARVRARSVSFIELATTGGLFYQVGSAVSGAVFIYVAIEYLHIDLARLLVLLLIFLRLAPRFSALQESMQLVAANLPAFTNLKRLQDIYEDAAEDVRGDPAAAPSLQRSVRFEDVCLYYGAAPVAALDHVSCTIGAGRATALIGASGSGKSTLADLLMGLSRPTSGRILIDGLPLDAGNRRAWRRRVAYVPQEPFLLNDSIAANFRLARPDASEGQMLAALEKARAADFVGKLPQGLDTLVGERGTRFSGGERQRLSLARALLTDPALLILDEATSALDWRTQQEISQIIAGLKGQMTVFSIAHRPSMIRFADDVLVIEGGRIVEAGPFAEMAACPDSQLARLLRGEEIADPHRPLAAAAALQA